MQAFIIRSGKAPFRRVRLMPSCRQTSRGGVSPPAILRSSLHGRGDPAPTAPVTNITCLTATRYYAPKMARETRPTKLTHGGYRIQGFS